jgi:hypothetical protein
MKNEIVGKLRAHLSDPVETESQVVYLLCQVRKLLDMQPRDPKWLALRFHCSWALHIDLSMAGTTREFLTRVDDYVWNRLNTPHRDEKEEIAWEQRAHEMILEFIDLPTFRTKLREVLNIHSLPTTVCDDNKLWFKFLAAYSGVVEDVPLTCSGKGMLKVVDKVTFRKGQAIDIANMPFWMAWEILQTNGQPTMKIDGYTLSRSQGMVHRVRHHK